MIIPNTIKIDLDGQREIYSDIVLSVGDLNAYGLIFDFYKGGTRFDVTGYNLAIMATRSGSTIPIPDTGIIQNGKGYYTIKPSMYAYQGKTKIEVVLSDFTGMFYVANIIYFDVRSGFSSLGGAVADEADFTVLSSLISQAQAKLTDMDNAISHANGLKIRQYVIAPSNAVNKERADLILTGTNDAAAINAAFTSLAALRASDDVAIRIDFLGGDIEVDGGISVPTNFKLYGNGVRIMPESYSQDYFYMITTSDNIYIDGIRFIGYNKVINCINISGNATIVNCECEGAVAEGINDAGTSLIMCCYCHNNYTGIRAFGADSIITNNRCINNTGANILDVSSDTVIANNIAPEVEE